MTQASHLKIEYGDFQTPMELAEKICCKLVELGINPKVIVEPTCGTGNFIRASASLFRRAERIIGLEINPKYLEQIWSDNQLSKDKRIQARQENFFSFD